MEHAHDFVQLFAAGIIRALAYIWDINPLFVIVLAIVVGKMFLTRTGASRSTGAKTQQAQHRHAMALTRGSEAAATKVQRISNALQKAAVVPNTIRTLAADPGIDIASSDRAVTLKTNLAGFAGIEWSLQFFGQVEPQVEVCVSSDEGKKLLKYRVRYCNSENSAFALAKWNNTKFVATYHIQPQVKLTVN